MLMSFSKHNGKSVELLMFTDPSFIRWAIDEFSSEESLAVKNHIFQLMKIFDSKPFVNKACSASECAKPATRFFVYLDNLTPSWWCDTCDPYQWGAREGNLQSPINYHTALLHVKMFCGGRKSDYTKLIKTIAQAKGLPERVGESAAQQFFSTGS